MQYAKRVPGGWRGRTRVSSARDEPPAANAPTSAVAGPSGSRWSSTQSTPLVIRATSRTGTPR